MARSIRRQALAWHAVVLVLALGGLGGALFFQVRASRLAEVDAELEGEARVLATRLQPPRPPDLPGRPPRDRFGPPEEFADGPDRRRGPRPPFADDPTLGDESRPPRDRLGPRRRGPRPPLPPAFRLDELELPQDFVRRFPEGDRPYFVVYGPGGRVLKTSGPDPSNSEFPAPFPAREVRVPGPDGMQVAVGRRIGREEAELRRLAVWIVATAAGVLALAVAGDVLISKRLVRPIDEMTRAASAVSASDLSRRIDSGASVAELEGLARTLNDAFARLEAAFRQQARFTADASHELRTPLAVLSSAAELALSRERAPAEYRASLETCLRTAKRMRSLVEALLTLARCDAGAIASRRESVDLAHAAADASDLIEPLARDRAIRVLRDLAPAATHGDPAALGQVVTNLLANAVRYNRDAGEVRVSTRLERGEAVLRVSDTGIGIPPEHREQVFERFHRVDAARSRDSGGCGLGLAISKSVVEAHGGRIELESEAGRGTTVTVRLPATDVRVMPQHSTAKSGLVRTASPSGTP